MVSACTVVPSAAQGALKAITKPIRFGIIADTHIGFVDDAETRFAGFMRAMKKFAPDGLFQLGDFAYPNRKYQKVAQEFNDGAEFPFHVIGNHDLDHSHTKDDCINAWGMPGPYYARELKGLRVIVLDGNDRGSPTHARHGGYPSYIAEEQRKWLDQQLSSSTRPVLIVSHQPLAGRIAIDNAVEIQKLITRHKDKVILCINGHSHVDQMLKIGGVPYLHFNSASYFWLGGKVRLAKYSDPLFATMVIDPVEGKIRIDGVRSSWLNGTPKDAEYFTGKNAGLEEVVVPEIRDRVLTLNSPG